jgi:hypothetical protein
MDIVVNICCSDFERINSKVVDETVDIEMKNRNNCCLIFGIMFLMKSFSDES